MDEIIDWLLEGPAFVEYNTRKYLMEAQDDFTGLSYSQTNKQVLGE